MRMFAGHAAEAIAAEPVLHGAGLSVSWEFPGNAAARGARPANLAYTSYPLAGAGKELPRGGSPGSALPAVDCRVRGHFRTTRQHECMFWPMGRVKESGLSDGSKPPGRVIAVTSYPDDKTESTDHLPRDMSYDYIG
jgi:hypothetical protein